MSEHQQQQPALAPFELAWREEKAAAHGGEEHRAVFTGSGWEYFRVWIVNLALSILTLGIFSAWAKVRNKRYFYGNTLLDGAAFDYTANPLTILKGRIVLAAYVLVYTILGNVYPLAQLLLVAATLPFVPWVINRSLAFNHRYTAHRGLRFGFDGTYRGALLAFLAWPALATLTAGLTFPLAAHRAKAYLVANSRFGRAYFDYNGRASVFFGAYAIALVLGVVLVFGVILGIAGMIGIQTVLASGGSDGAGSALPQAAHIGVIAATALASLLILIVPATLVQTLVANHVWQTSGLQRDRFEMRMSVLRVLWIQLTNLILIVLTFGLFVPFAKVRMLRYRLASFAMHMREGPQAYRAGARDRVGAVGDELGEAFGLELGF